MRFDVVRIGDSIPAPNFRLVAQPNDWEKQVKAATGVAALSERSRLYWDFWEQFLARVAAEYPEWTKAKSSTRESWYDLPSGIGGVVYESAFIQQGLKVLLSFVSPDAAVNISRFQALKAAQHQFERELGEPALWDDKPGKKSAAVYLQSEFGDVTDVEQWPAMLDWLLERNVRFRRAIEAVGGVTSLG